MHVAHGETPDLTPKVRGFLCAYTGQMEYIPAVYQTPGRVSVDYIVIHWINGNLDSCIATFTNGERQASAHYGIENSRVVNFVDEGNTAWACGNWEANQSSISIEHSAQPGRVATDLTYATSIALIASLMVKYGLEPSRETIRGHSEFYATQCPGTMDLDRIIAGVKNILNNTEENEMGVVLEPEHAEAIAKRAAELVLKEIAGKLDHAIRIDRVQAEAIAARSAYLTLEKMPNISNDVLVDLKKKIESLNIVVEVK